MASTKIVRTADGSDTLYSEQHKAHYHSLHGAILESLHIFVKSGYKHLALNEISILEVGFGTGLNAALTASKANEMNRKTTYTGIELYPLEKPTLAKINYGAVLKKDESIFWKKINISEWNTETPINDSFLLTKLHADICTVNLSDLYHLVYFDAFAPEDQPEVWSSAIFQKLFNATNRGGILITYCSKGIVKQALRGVGYKVERLAGPPGKRHILRAVKP
ncbi:MAG: SAM-dependent methyltransferase [Bacteroidales bacterium]|nr:MAG: SAM-dependent methyltransferase [Bacteroidales bacterium]